MSRIPKPILRLYYEITIFLQQLFQEFITLKDKLSLRFRRVISESVEFLLAVRLYMPQVLRLTVGLEFLESITNMLGLRLRNVLLLLEQIHARLRSVISETVSLETLSRIAYGVRGLVNLITLDQISHSLSAVLREISRCLDNISGALRHSILETLVVNTYARAYNVISRFVLLALSEFQTLRLINSLAEILKCLESLAGSLRRTISETLAMSARSLYFLGVTRTVLLGLSESIVRRLSTSFLEALRTLEQLIGSLRRPVSEAVNLSVLLRYYLTIVGSSLLVLSEAVVRRVSSSTLEFLRIQEQFFGSLRRSVSESLTLIPRYFIRCLQRILVNLVLTEVILRRLSSLQFERCRTPDQGSWSLRRTVTDTVNMLVSCPLRVRTLTRANLVVNESITYTRP